MNKTKLRKTSLTLRLQAELKKRLAESAQAQGNSLQAQIIKSLEKYYEGFDLQCHIEGLITQASTRKWPLLESTINNRIGDRLFQLDKEVTAVIERVIPVAITRALADRLPPPKPSKTRSFFRNLAREASILATQETPMPQSKATSAKYAPAKKASAGKTGAAAKPSSFKANAFKKGGGRRGK